FDDELILKVYRRLEAGINPELEMLRFLSEHEFENVPPLHGWYAYHGRPAESTLGVLQAFVPDGRDGWELALDELVDAPERFLGRLRRLGEVTGAMHTCLASDSTDPCFAPEEPSPESLGLLTATIDEEIDRAFIDLPDDLEAIDPIRQRGQEIRERLRLWTHLGGGGRSIRHHGDFHLGQTILVDDDWVILDFEGEPARSLPERRQKRSPLRDVAGMVRSFAYAASAVDLLRGAEAPPGWEERARTEFLDGYLGAVDPLLVPPGPEAFEKLLSVYELEKAVYELRYELSMRPDWLPIPVAGILRILEEEPVAT
ncbi:MAG TPA: phosphotransferase, partial [Gaiellaceae bacterium]